VLHHFADDDRLDFLSFFYQLQLSLVARLSSDSLFSRHGPDDRDS